MGVRSNSEENDPRDKDAALPVLNSYHQGERPCCHHESHEGEAASLLSVADEQWVGRHDRRREYTDASATRPTTEKSDGRDGESERNRRQEAHGGFARRMGHPELEKTEIERHVAVAFGQDIGPSRLAHKAQARRLVKPERIVPDAVPGEARRRHGAYGHRPEKTAIVDGSGAPSCFGSFAGCLDGRQARHRRAASL